MQVVDICRPLYKISTGTPASRVPSAIAGLLVRVILHSASSPARGGKLRESRAFMIFATGAARYHTKVGVLKHFQAKSSALLTQFRNAKAGRRQIAHDDRHRWSPQSPVSDLSFPIGEGTKEWSYFSLFHCPCTISIPMAYRYRCPCVCVSVCRSLFPLSLGRIS